MSDYEKQLEQQNEELRAKLAEYEAYKIAFKPLLKLLIRCEGSLTSTSEFMNSCIESNSNTTAEQDATAYKHIMINMELADACNKLYHESINDVKDFNNGKWLDFYNEYISMDTEKTKITCPKSH